MNHRSICRDFVLAAIAALLLLPPAAEATRLKDLATVKGVRQNQLVGYGLVVGLQGTGDGNNASFTTQGLINMMESMGVHVSQSSIRVKNVAGVMVTANLPPFVKVGQPIDITVSSLGDATSLQGGTLVVTPLKGLDGQVYAMAQGPISIGGFPLARVPGNQQKNQLTVARVPGGATVEREVPVSFQGKGEIALSLESEDFTTAARAVKAINRSLGGKYARAEDGATIQVSVPESYRQNEVALLAALENVEVTPDVPAKIVLDERTGTIVMGENVRVSSLAVSHGNLSLQITPGPVSAQKGSRLGDRVVTLGEGATIGDVARALNSIGASPQDLIAIFQAIKAAGALQADLEII
ncbi:MAG: flagellar basal body P-ring protein FlgI [Desulfobacteraceae bacterium]|nr:flagellar basal body P-ring protein FlgI [Desulfobacteraceae bacterium]